MESVDRSMLRWHYTTGVSLKQILESGQLIPAFVHTAQKHAVWFSKNTAWDTTANKMWRQGDGTMTQLNMEQTHEKCGGLVRIGVAPETAPHDWKAFKKMSGIHHKMASALYSIAIEEGVRPGDWFVSFEPIPAAQWVAMEYWNGSEWVSEPPQQVA